MTRSAAAQQSLLPAGSDFINTAFQPAQPSAFEEVVSDTDEASETLYAQGTRAIHEGRWSDAESIFDKLAQHRGDHAEGSNYWKAFAQNKQGKSDTALKTCADLRQAFPKSRWNDDCGALEIEIRGKSGHPIEPQSEQDENLKLLALNTLMHQDESRALPQIQQILAGDQSETFKEQALFVLAESSSQSAEQMLIKIAHPAADSPAGIRSNAGLQQRAQQLIAATQRAKLETGQLRGSHRIGLDVLVTDASGKPVTGLSPQDFTVLDNGQPQKILSFRSSDASRSSQNGVQDPPAEVVLVIDTVNASLTDVAYERLQIETYLQQDGGHLANPVTLLFLNGDGAKRVAPPSRDGNLLAAALEKASSNLHPIRRSEAYYGAVERLQLSVGTLGSMTTELARTPGRKIVIWLSPGWPLLVGTEFMPSARQLKTTFSEIVALSTGLRQARITLYSIDPTRAAGTDSLEWFRYKDYLKPVTRDRNANIGDLALQVLSEQSGGRAMNYSTQYLSGEIADCVREAASDYFLSYDAPHAGQEDEYHELKITVDKPGTTVRTRSGYYNEP